MHLLNIEANYSFLDSLYEFLSCEFTNDITMSEITVFLPSRRSVNELKRIFLKNSKQQSKILPTIKAIGDIDYDDILPNCSDLSLVCSYHDLFKIVSNTKYKLLLLKEMLDNQRNLNIEQAINFSHEFELFLKNIEENKVNLNDLTKVIDDEFAIHWQKTLGFLKSFALKWKEILEINGMTSIASSIVANIDLQTESVKFQKPKHPIIIAGISHMIKSAVEFTKALSKYDNTYFITKGAENVLEERDFNEIIETHSHYRFKKLFEFLNVKNYKNIRYDKYITLNKDYANAIYNSMLPYNLTHKWSDTEVSVFPNIEYCEFNNLQDELEFINFYILNYINENGLKNIAIVIDQDLSYRFESILKLWKIPYNNTYGYKFLSHNLIKYMFLVIDVYNSNYKKDLFLSLLKNNFSYFGYSKSELEENIYLFEKHILEDKINKNGMKSYRYNLEYVDDVIIKDKIKIFLDRIESYFDSISNCNYTFSELLKKHIELVERITNIPKNSEGNTIWYKDYGSEIIFDFLVNDVIKDSECIGFVNTNDYLSILKYTCFNKSYSEKYSEYPAVNIISIKETRLINYDLVVIANLNDGSIPESVKIDPWMNNTMRETLGIPPKEQELGQSCYEFIQLLMQKNVLLTRSTKIDDVGTIKSRFLQRIEAFLDCSGIKLKQPEDIKTAFYRYYEYPYSKSNDIYKKRPKPKPPINIRPRELSATNIDLLNINPYDVYVKKILNLKKINILTNKSIFSKVGTVLHEVFEKFCRNYTKYSADKQKSIENILELCIQKYFSDDEVTKEFYRQKLLDSCYNFLEFDNKSRLEGFNVSVEVNSSYKLREKNFVVSARIDRIEDKKDGILKIVDYKTGTVPSIKDVISGRALQLPIESLILQHSGFNIDSVEYWSIKSNNDAKIITIKNENNELINNVEEFIGNLIDYFNNEDNGYVATNKNPHYSDFTHLSRIDDWLY